MAKNIYWLGRSQAIVRGFAKFVRSEIGYQLYRLQQGLLPTDYKPMPRIGVGVYEFRLHKPNEHRVIYVTKFENCVYVLHAFEKKTQKTTKMHLEIAAKNYRDLMRRIRNLRIEE